MPKKMLIDATHAEETRVVVVDGTKVEEFDFESENKRQLAGNIYLAKVTRVEPSLQAAFVDYGGNRHGFLAFSEIHPDYYQIPVADREALMEEERAYAESLARREDEDEKPKSRRGRGRNRSRAAKAEGDDAVTTKEVSDDISGMETIDFSGDDDEDEAEGLSPMETVAETPVEEPDEADSADATDLHDEDDDVDDLSQPADRDENIESVADDDTHEDIRPRRKPRPKRYKIQEVIKVRQILLVQVVKEERGNKGAALTTYLSLAGRYCVLMPNTARGGGISRKITNAPDRKKLKEIANEIDVPQGAGLIIRTAGAKRTKTEIKRDYEYLQRLWEQIRELTLKSIAPAKIYEEGDLIKRSIRDLYNRDIDEVLVEGERGYRIAKDFMKMIMPSHAKNVKHYADQMPLFARHQVESYLSGMFNPTVQLKSGGYIVIGVTEALVAIDVNSGRATKEGSIEETALKTNLEAAEEVARQLRLRDLAGLIVIDFIDMDERKNNASVEKRIKDKLKNDRARIQVGRISGFGLMEMSRQRLRPGMIEATTQPCPSCHGTGLIRSDDNMALQVLRQIEEEGVRRRSREVLVKCPVSIANFLMNQKREHVAQIETRYGLSVRIEGDVHLVSPDFSMEKFKTATRVVPEAPVHVVSVDTSLMDQVDEDAADEDEEDEEQAEVVTTPTSEEDDGKPKKRRRRSRRGGRGRNRNRDRQDDGEADTDTDADTNETADSGDEATPSEPVAAEAVVAEAATDAAPQEDAAQAKPKRTRSRSRKPAQAAKDSAAETEVAAVEAVAPVDAVSTDAVAAPDAAPAVEDAPKKKPRSRSRKKAEPAAEAPEGSEVVADAEEAAPKPKKAPVKRTRAKKPAKTEEPVAVIPTEEIAPVPEVVTPVAADEPAPEPVAEPAPVPEVAAEPEVTEQQAVEPEAEAPVAAPEPEPVGADAEAGDDADSAKKKRRGWWSLGR
ncbi:MULTISPECIES: Rne/Rng family ribonuclease [Marivita]|uniref:Ribonuclease E n=1 Tax=Marivita cryptomonadis TaxID=505252 RepID=A0A9Q2NUT4_9RHOB|nr:MULTISPECIES: ribonuclease E/G [Marivita]MCR9169717.1 Rne/Rng family ribonuclease [Paracoccaceae bacterium]MBM2320203.1 Rne/Rng family ribonuclease [Marivita cryptomonadis]MBM2329782.1 Rne/Rng family ribonuclease [Marivita cryptomonadis]MBM2339370.1 Rne/Rng family ribonuclease [Marivita cryptomonadis]MBM2344028.1 Rne/Rng family ribonuclease [Marivita cryptomonadis]